MLKAFFKPKWLHNDPQVRLHALQALDASRPENREVLQAAATSDSDTLVRRAAIKRINDLDILWRIAQNELDAESRSTAQQRFVALLAGVESGAPPLGALLQHLAAVTDQKIIDEIARRGVEIELRLAALQRVEREALLGDIALNDKDAGLRVAAVERIMQKSTLERVAKNARTKDKRVSGVARGKLEKLATEADRPARLQQRARNVCVTLTGLTQSKDLGEAPERMHAAEMEWTAILNDWDSEKDGAFAAELAQHYTDARAALETLLEKHAQIAGQQRAMAAQREALRAKNNQLCEQLESIATTLEQHTAPDAEDKRRSTTARRQIQDEWQASGDLPAAEQHSLRTRYDAAVSRIDACSADIACLLAAQENADILLARAQTLLKADSPPQESDIKTLEIMRKAITQPRHYALDAAIYQGLDEAFSQLNARHAQHLQKVKDDVEKLKHLVKGIEQAAADGLSKQATALQREAQQIYAALPPHDAGILRKQGLVSRWQAAEKAIRELWSWKKWAGAPVKERLVEEMEALARALNEPSELERDYYTIAQQIHQAREQWKNLGATDTTTNQLWQRFTTACDAAHAPCAAFFSAERAQRAEHAQQKQAICTNLEQFIAQTDWDHADWKKVERALRDGREEWSRVGPTERAQSKTLSKRFNALMDDLAARLAAERKLNKTKKETLIKGMEQIADSLQNVSADSPAVQDAVKQARQLQSQWKTLGMSTDSATLWNTFRAASDRVFARRQALHEAQDQEHQANLELKRALCAQIEELAQLQGDALVQARSRLQQAKNDFESAGPVAKQDSPGIQQRFRDACLAFEKQERTRQVQAREQSILLLQRKAQLCCELDGAICALLGGALTQEAAEAHLNSAQDSWQSLAPLEDAIEKRIAARFQCTTDSLRGLLGDKRAEYSDNFTKQQQANLATKEQLCLRAEISAGIDSPSEYRQQRMQFQVELLTRRLRAGEPDTDAVQSDAEALTCEWEFIGSVPVTAADTLQARFNRAHQALRNL